MPGRGLSERFLTTLVAAAGLVVATAPAAHAVTHAQLWCESGGGKYHCTVEHDGTAPLTIRWTINGSPSSGLDDRAFTGLRTCGQAVLNVTATVTDPTGSKTADLTFLCNYGPWP